jgi:hypothetical protein
MGMPNATDGLRSLLPEPRAAVVTITPPPRDRSTSREAEESKQNKSASARAFGKEAAKSCDISEEEAIDTSRFRHRWDARAVNPTAYSGGGPLPIPWVVAQASVLRFFASFVLGIGFLFAQEQVFALQRLKQVPTPNLLNDLACVSLSTPPASNDPGPAVTQEEIDGWTKLWQKRLDLVDWRIGTMIVRQTELKPETLGNLHWDTEVHTATIRVLDPCDYELPAWEVPEDIEYTIVHELIHLQLSVLPRDTNARIVEERVVNKISNALFQLEKGPGYRLHVAPAANASGGQGK